MISRPAVDAIDASQGDAARVALLVIARPKGRTRAQSRPARRATQHATDQGLVAIWAAAPPRGAGTASHLELPVETHCQAGELHVAREIGGVVSKGAQPIVCAHARVVIAWVVYAIQPQQCPA